MYEASGCFIQGREQIKADLVDRHADAFAFAATLATVQVYLAVIDCIWSSVARVRHRQVSSPLRPSVNIMRGQINLWLCFNFQPPVAIFSHTN